MSLDLNELRSRLHYDPETGHFTRLDGRRIGHNGPNGYRQITIGNKPYREHWLAWFYVHGVWPAHQLDHANRKRDDNRLANLREATSAQNCHNRTRVFIGRCGFVGVKKLVRSTRFMAQMKMGDSYLYLGGFDSASGAAMAYDRAAIYFHGEFAATNFSLGLL